MMMRTAWQGDWIKDGKLEDRMAMDEEITQDNRGVESLVTRRKRPRHLETSRLSL
jgi:hypothetical protein